MILVVLHHSMLAYVSYGNGVLINDSQNFAGFEWIALYNDNFFMFLFFFISGLFSLNSLSSKGIIKFLNDRFIRLMLPFAVGTLLINPLGHYLGYIYYIEQPFSFADLILFVKATFGETGANHLWFLWVLFVFSVILAVIYKIMISEFEKIESGTNQSHISYSKFIIGMIILGSLTFIPIAHIGNSGFVMLLKPFQLQISRVFLYFLFFISGSLIGYKDLKGSFLFHPSFMKKWWMFIGISVAALVLHKNLLNYVYSGTEINSMTAQVSIFLLKFLPVVISIFASLGFLGLFNGYINNENKLFTLFARAAMGIYVIHYTVVTVYQYIFTTVDISGLAKGIAVWLLSLLTSLALVLIFKKAPFLRIVFGEKYSEKYSILLCGTTIIMTIVLVIA
jgi:surface polysaccharide O-acyltransferase-like enzyme